MSRPKKAKAEAALDAYLQLDGNERRIFRELLAYMERNGLIGDPAKQTSVPNTISRLGRRRKPAGHQPDGMPMADNG